MSDTLANSAREPVPAAPAIPGYIAGTWRLDPANSEIGFAIHQMLVSTVRGRFTDFDATIVTADDPQHSSVTATIALASIDTGNSRRDHHLRSAGYLDADGHPTVSYRSTGIARHGDGWLVDGQLTLHGVTRPVALSLQLKGFGPGPDGGRRARFSATAQLNRREFGITGGAGMVSKHVAIDVEIGAVLQR